MNWKLNAPRAMKAYVGNYGANFTRMCRLYGFDTAQHITDVQEALVIGIQTLSYYQGAKDSKAVNDMEWDKLR